MTAAVVTLVSANSGPALSLREYIMAPAAPAAQTEKQADAKSSGCLSCHTVTDRHTMHANPGVVLGCTDCHGGNASVIGEGKPESAAYRSALDAAHILPRNEKYWKYPSSANPQGSYAKLNQEHPAYIRFINPGDLRVARDACGACHLPIIQAQERSLMATSAMLWGGASYNNGILPYKRYILGESYTPEGAAAAIVNPLRVDNQLFVDKGILDRLYPLPAWETIARPTCSACSSAAAA
jgi:cytochrome c551/c552